MAEADRAGDAPKDRRRNDGGRPGRDVGRDAQDVPPHWRTEGLPDSPQPPRFRWGRMLVLVVVGWLVLFGLTTTQDQLASRVTTIPYSEFTEQVGEGNVETVFSRGDTIEGVLIEAAELPEDGGTYTEFVTERPTFAQDDLLSELEQHGAVVAATPLVQERGILSNLLISLLPLALIVAFWVWLFRRQAKAMGGMGGEGLLGSGSKKVKPVEPESVRVNFDDVAGIDEVNAELTQVVSFLKEPDRYTNLGAKLPKGVLLEGQPGTGKTLIARATAGEADVPFFSASGSEFVEMIVGVGAQRVRQLFEEARKVAPSIIFIDEIDTIGRARSGPQASGSNTEQEQTLNQILTEMDGFSGSEGVVVLAATNRSDMLDPALTRAGRFDRKITVSAPDQVGRRQILEVHTRGKPLGPDVTLEDVAKSAPGMTGADLAHLANEAAILAVERGGTALIARDFAVALEKVQLGSERSMVMPQEERVRTAYHEAGHALLGMLQPGADPVRKVSIIPRGRALGVTLSTPETDRYGYDVDYLKGRIIGALGGMAAEQEIFGVITTGAESDLQQVTAIARQMVGRWGMSPTVGPIQVYPREGDPRQSGASDQLLATVDDEVRALIASCYDAARHLLREHRPKLDAIVAALLEHETLDEYQAYEAAGVEQAPARPLLVGALPGSPGHDSGGAQQQSTADGTSRD
ncbi:ATP-dependent zinc metalloprotease FtsH [Pseudactinotalea sp. Z1748]|uniref:ATP-dependent zinc metalloprotease FtsH n=1 Tax=Pseudactinotalea sp. Z1748 TaxID=3413027 RepID=UPI003C7A841D